MEEDILSFINDMLLFQDPKVYVETILEVHHKYNALVLTAFNNDAGFVAALDKVLYGVCPWLDETNILKVSVFSLHGNAKSK